jgi:hypothetical protein
MLSHQQEIPIASTDTQENWGKFEQEARQLIEKITEGKNSGVALTAETLSQLLRPSILLSAELPRTNSDEEGPDALTNTQAVIEFVGTLILNALCFGLILDTLKGKENDCNPESFDWVSAGIGAAIGLILASGEVLCHRIINTVNQSRDASLAQVSTENVSLTPKQKVALGIEAIAHVGEVASQYVVLSRFVTQDNNWRIGIYIGAIIAGIFGSMAETRTHLNSIRRYNSLRLFDRPKPAEIAEETDENQDYAYRALNGGHTPRPNGHATH